MRIYIQYPGGITSIDDEPSDSIQALRSNVALALPQYSDVSRIVLTYSNQILMDTFTLSDYSILKDSTIFMTYSSTGNNTSPWFWWFSGAIIFILIFLSRFPNRKLHITSPAIQKSTSSLLV